MSAQIPITTTQASSGISPDLRNNIYSALLSHGGIRTIESVLDETLRSTGFHDALKAYITEILRSGQATTAEQARNLAMAKIHEQMRADGGAKTNGAVNGNGTSTNGEVEELDLRIPKEAVRKGTKTIMRELEKVCEITYEDDE
jgi:hypothetical protein